MRWTVTVLDRAFGNDLVPWEYWIHREGESIRTYRAMSRAEAEELVAILNEREKVDAT